MPPVVHHCEQTFSFNFLETKESIDKLGKTHIKRNFVLNYVNDYKKVLNGLYEILAHY